MVTFKCLSWKQIYDQQYHKSNILDFTIIVADENEIFQTMSSLQMKITFRHLESKWVGETD